MKNFIEWTDELSVGIQEIDEQHKILVDLLNRLYKAIVRKTEAAIVNEVLDELTQYTQIHFAVEESLMRIFQYPQYATHRKFHEELTEQVILFRSKVQHEQESASLELLHFLRNWLTKHIIGEDKKYASFFLERGVKGAWAEQSWIGKIWNKKTRS